MLRPILLGFLVLCSCAKLNASFQDSGSGTEGSSGLDSESPTTSDSDSKGSSSMSDPTDGGPGPSGTGNPTDPGPGTDSHGSGTTTGFPATDSSTSFAETGVPPACPQPDQLCDPYDDQCPPGQTCRPYAPDGDEVPTLGGCFWLEPSTASEVDMPCESECGPFGGEDSCGARLICDPFAPMTSGPHCTRLCRGAPNDPSCEIGLCFNYPGEQSEASFGLCRGSCNPLLQDCLLGENCIPDPEGPYCAPIQGGDGGGVGDECEQSSDCAAGLSCEDGDAVPGCADSNDYCCTPLCDLQDVECPDTSTCVPYFEFDGVETTVGVCLG